MPASDSRAGFASSAAAAPDPGSSILVVDDVDANLVALEAALASLDRRIVAARSGTEALSRLLEEDFALVLLDVQMPGMDGYETAKWIRSRERTRHLPIIFLTAHSHDDAEVRRGYRLGIVDFLFKPLDAEVLCAKAQVFIALHERTKQVAELQVQRRLEEHRQAFEEEALRREMNAQRAAKAELERLNAQLAAADDRKTEFLAMLAHELRNPLAPIQTAVDLIRDSAERPAPRLLDIVDRQLGQVTRLVDDLLDVARITAGKIDLKLTPVDLAIAVDVAVTASRPLADSRRQSLTVRSPDQPVPVNIDVNRFVQILCNLLTNACRYTPSGGAIEVAWGATDVHAFVRVADNGIGIDPASLESVFEMFVQEREGDDGAGGLGVGLALARRLAEMHGGALRATSAGRGQGSTFEVLVPLGEAALPEAAAPRGSIEKRRRPSANPLRAIVIDDNEDSLALTAELLASYGHDVLTAADGATGLAMICEHRPDVALVDLGLPRLDGFELVTALRERCPDLKTRLVAMTGYGQESDFRRTRDAGFDDHLVKPASSSAILNAVEPEA